MAERQPRRFDSAATGKIIDGRSDAPKLALSRRHAAAALGMSLRHFQRHVQPHLRCVHSGQLRLYPLAELERWMTSNSSEAVDKW